MAMARPMKWVPFPTSVVPFNRGPWPLNRRRREVLTLHVARDMTLTVGVTLGVELGGLVANPKQNPPFFPGV